MEKLSEQLRALYDEWFDFIIEEIDRIDMDNTAKVNEIFALRNAIHENEDKLATIQVQIRRSPYEMPDIVKKVDNARDYTTYVVDTIDKIKIYNSDEDNDDDEEPFTHCDNCGEAIWEEDDIVYGDYGHYCCDECREEAEDEDEEPAAYCDNCGTVIWNEDKIVYGVDGKYCCDECCREDEGAGEEEDEDEIEDEE